jgi:FkbM family methyltransferase
MARSILRRFGLDVVRYVPPPPTGSVRTNALTYFQTTTGNYYLPTDAHDDGVANAIKANKVFDSQIVDLATRYIRPDTTVLDVGANFGQMSILFSRHVGSQGKVYSFEADSFVFEILSKNIEANNRKGTVLPIFGAVHDVADQILFFPVQDFARFGTYGSYGIDYNAKGGREVKSLTIDSLDIKDPISFMKVDVQGGDLLAMRGAVNTIKKNKMPIIFEYEYLFEDDYKLSFQEYVDFVRDIDYKFVKVINGHNFLILPRQA